MHLKQGTCHYYHPAKDKVGLMGTAPGKPGKGKWSGKSRDDGGKGGYAGSKSERCSFDEKGEPCPFMEKYGQCKFWHEKMGAERPNKREASSEGEPAAKRGRENGK